MKQRGRTSAASDLGPVAIIERVERPAAPDELTEEQREIWRQVVYSQPADWFSPANVPLLVQYCRHTIYARRLAHEIEQTAEPDTRRQLLGLHQAETAVMLKLASTMRLSQRSLLNDRGSNRNRIANTAKPWEG